MVLQAEFWGVLFGAAVLFWRLPRHLRLYFLAVVSIGFLATLAWEPTVGLLVWVVLFWLLVREPSGASSATPDDAGNGRSARRSFHVLLILAVLGQLAYFKYLPPLIAALASNPLEEHVVVPLGMSFFTFKLVHYALERSQGMLAKHGFDQFLSYMFAFPIFTAGPIERFDDYLANQESRWSLETTCEGLTRIAIGLIKRFLIAQALLVPWLEPRTEIVFGDLSRMSTGQVWLYAATSFVYVYLDFSAYSDIGIGGLRLFGLRIQENFHFPLIATDISDFWKRWHISLSRWCQAYVYLPTIGYTRNPYLATYATFLVMGLWHAGTLNRIGWGLYHATGVAIYTTWTRIKRKRKWTKTFKRPLLRYAGMPITLAFIAGSATFLVAEEEGGGLRAALRILLAMLGLDAGGA